MSLVQVQGNASGTGTLTIASPNTNSNYTLTLPTATTELVGTDATQTLTNKTIQGGAITSGTAVASTSGTSIDFTSIPSWVKRITVMFAGVSTSGGSNYQVQLGDSGGVETTGYLSSVALDNSTHTQSTTGLIITTTIDSSSTVRGFITIVLLDSSTNTWVSNGVGHNNIAPLRTFFMAGSKSLSATLNRVRITTVNGTDTFDAGTINIMYEG